jgi:antitoxin component of MazEF toxin-antitoxin module
MQNNQKLREIALPADVCGPSGFTDEDTLELHVAEGALVFLKDRMTALEVAKAIESLNGLATELIVTLASACGVCDNCVNAPEPCEISGCPGDPAEGVASCSLCMDLLDTSQTIRIPEYILEEAGIPMGTKLEAYTDEDSGEITIAAADIQQDITDISPDILEVLALSGICLAELDELIMLEEIIYGE